MMNILKIIPEDVTVIGVTKTVDVTTAKKLLAAGINHFGENRVNDFLEKHAAFSAQAIT